MSNSTIMSVREMIDIAFGESEVNIVNLKLVQTILYLLARQLRVLERRVAVEIGTYIPTSSSSLSIYEVKMLAHAPKKRKKAGDTSQQKESKVEARDSRHRTSNKSPSDKATAKSIVEKRLIPDKSASGKQTSVSTPGNVSSDKTTTSTDKSTSERTKTTTENSTSDRTKTSTEKSTSDKTKSSTDKSTSDDTKILTEKSTSDRTKSSTEKSTSDETKTSTEKSTSDRTKSSSEKTSSDKTKSSTEKSTSRKDTSTSEEYHRKDIIYTHLDALEEEREKELRIIHQRADSREEPEKTPTPIASLESTEIQYEKLLVVERMPTHQAEVTSEKSHDRMPQLSVVTQEQFEELAETVRGLRDQLGPVATADFGDNMQLMQELRKGASLTDAMAALQLSARLEAAEKTLQKMLSLITDLASRTGIDLSVVETKTTSPKTEVLFGAPKTSIRAEPPKSQVMTGGIEPSNTISVTNTYEDKISVAPHLEKSHAIIPEKLKKGDKQSNLKIDWINIEELDDAMQEVYDKLFQNVTSITTKNGMIAEQALKVANRQEAKLDAALNLNTRMNDLENLVTDYAEQINILDTGLTSQMTNYQEHLTQMQHDLESGIEAMSEALANTSGDAVAVAELNANFSNLQMDIDYTNLQQKELKDIQKILSLDLQALWQQIEFIRESKSDRDEVADALRDKAGLGALNGLVTREQFDAVRGDLEKRIGNAYDKFNIQENVWQKAIDDLIRDLNDKADGIQVKSLRDDINRHLETLRNRINGMMEIVGEPRAASITRKLFRDSNCLSCATPAHMDLEESTIPELPSFKKSSRQPSFASTDGLLKPKEDGDHAICYPGLPIPHQINPRSHICHRYCGGSHTTLPNPLNRATSGLTVNPVFRRDMTTTVGTDGKTYLIDEPDMGKKPCFPCNAPKVEKPPATEIVSAENSISDMASIDFLPPMEAEKASSDISITPPLEDD